jgi:hypothetical protein
VLAKEYENAERVGFTMGVNWLCENYTGIRRVCGDGNCFYRAFLFAYLEMLIRGNLSDNGSFYQEERARMLSIITGSKDIVVAQGYDEFVIETFYDASSHRDYTVDFSIYKLWYLVSSCLYCLNDCRPLWSCLRTCSPTLRSRCWARSRTP